MKPPIDYRIAVVPDLSAGGPKDATGGLSLRRLAQAAPPMWITHGGSVLEKFGGQLPFQDVVIVTGYPMSVLSTDYAFVIYRSYASATVPGGNDMTLLTGRITREQIARWR